MQATGGFDLVAKANDDVRKINKYVNAIRVGSSKGIDGSFDAAISERRVLVTLLQSPNQVLLLFNTCNRLQRPYN